MLFEAGQGFRPAFCQLENKMWASFAVLEKQYGRLDSSPNLWLMLQLYEGCVTPAGSFGAGLWGACQHMGAAKRGVSRLAAVRLKHRNSSWACARLWRHLSSGRSLVYSSLLTCV